MNFHLVHIDCNRLGAVLGLLGLVPGLIIFQYCPGPYNIQVALSCLVPGAFWIISDLMIRRRTGDLKSVVGGAWVNAPLWHIGILFSLLGLIFGIFCPKESKAEIDRRRAYLLRVNSLEHQYSQSDLDWLTKRAEDRTKQQGRAAGEALLVEGLSQDSHSLGDELSHMQAISPPPVYVRLHQEHIASVQQDIAIIEQTIKALRGHDATEFEHASEMAQAHEQQWEALQKRTEDEARKAGVDVAAPQ